MLDLWEQWKIFTDFFARKSKVRYNEKKMADYLLIVDDEEDLREILKLSAETIFLGPIHMAKSGNEAIAIVQKEGKPLACISDYRMPDGGGDVIYQYLEKNHPGTPFIFCSGCDLEEIRQKLPAIDNYIAKPAIHDALLAFLQQHIQSEGAVDKEVEGEKYLPVRLSLLIRLGFVNSDLFLKLSDTNFIKVFHPQSEFTPEDGLRFLKKNVVTLYLLKKEAPRFIHDFEKSLALFLAADEQLEPGAYGTFAAEALESTRKLIKVFGFSQETVRLAQQSLEMAHRAVSKQPELKKLLEVKLKDADGAFASHSSSIAFLACGITHYLEWASDFTRNKLSLAALLHDIYVDEDVYPFPQERNEQAAKELGSAGKTGNHSPSIGAYVDHPKAAAKLLEGNTEFPPDVDHIIAQHHERPDGTGFPHRLTSTRIHPLASLFIVVEDLVNFLGNREDLEAGVQEFLLLRAGLYGQGNFRKVMQALAIALPGPEKGSLA